MQEFGGKVLDLASMPQGVEHSVTADTLTLAPLLDLASMPQGVEHMRPA